jgi:biotin operon repressor
MLLFPQEEHDKIRHGEKTITFRDWDKLRVEAGMEYRSPGLGFVRVEEIGYVDFKKVPDEDFRAAGFISPDDFKTTFRKRNPGFNFGSGKLIRIRFTYLGREQRSAAGVAPSERELINIMERLVEIDVNSELEKRSEDFLEKLDPDQPQTSQVLADKLAITRDQLKKHMAKLKEEGLVALHRDGYVITLRGKTYLNSKI